MVASMIAELAKGGDPAFEPIEFTPGFAELDDTAKGYARSLAKLLAERPELSLKLCRRSTAQDMDRIPPGAMACFPAARPATEMGRNHDQDGQGRGHPGAASL